jgi:SAM-dependent methyltransferase
MTTNTLDEQRQATYDIAEAIAPGWERRRADIEKASAPVREWVLRALAPHSGDTVLELAAGVGDTGFDAAAVVGPRGSVITSDFSPGMLDAARRRGAERGVENAEYRLIDAERIELETDSVDGVLCRFGYMLMADPSAALAETRRVLRPGRRLALAVWGTAEANPFFGMIGLSLVKRGHMPEPEPPGPPVFGMADPERTAGLLRAAGFGDVRTEEVRVSFALADVDYYLSLIADTAGPIGLALGGLTAAEREEIRVEVADSLSRFATRSGYEVPGVALCAVAS